MSTQTLKLIETDSDFLNKVSNKINFNGEDWMHCPFWYRKISNGMFVEYRFEDLPEEFKEWIKLQREQKIIKP